MQQDDEGEIDDIPSGFVPPLIPISRSKLPKDDIGNCYKCAIFCPSGRICSTVGHFGDTVAYTLNSVLPQWFKNKSGRDLRLSTHNATETAASSTLGSDYLAFKELLLSPIAVFVETRQSSGSSMLAFSSQHLPNLRILISEETKIAHPFLTDGCMNVMIELKGKPNKWDGQIVAALNQQLGSTVSGSLGDLSSKRETIKTSYESYVRLFRAKRLSKQITIEAISKATTRPATLIRLLERDPLAWTFFAQNSVNDLFDILDLRCVKTSGFNFDNYVEQEFQSDPRLALANDFARALEQIEENPAYRDFRTDVDDTRYLQRYLNTTAGIEKTMNVSDWETRFRQGAAIFTLNEIIDRLIRKEVPKPPTLAGD